MCDVKAERQGSRYNESMNEKVIQQIQKKQIEDDLRGEFELTLTDRVNRYLAVKPHEIVTDTHFAAVSAECASLFRDGHFYGCIALTQAVAEALVRFICQRSSCKASDEFEKNVETLSKRKLISDDVKGRLLKVWERRNDYHHLNPNVERNRQELEKLAREKAHLLVEVEREIFAFTIVDGKLVPKYPKYWDITGNQAQVYLRLE